MTIRNVLSLGGAAAIFALSCFTLATVPTTVQAQTCEVLIDYITASCRSYQGQACASCLTYNCGTLHPMCYEPCVSFAPYC